MSRVSRTMTKTSSSPGPIRGGHRNGNNSSSVTLLSIIRFYLKIFVYILIVFFVVLQYINWKHASMIVLHKTNTNSAMAVESHQQQQQPQQQQPGEITTKIHIVFSTGCNAFQDCTSTLLFRPLYCASIRSEITLHLSLIPFHIFCRAIIFILLSDLEIGTNWTSNARRIRM